jgi:DNA repair exonuclease SbcCD ATPase subunit
MAGENAERIEQEKESGYQKLYDNLMEKHRQVIAELERTSAKYEGVKQDFQLYILQTAVQLEKLGKSPVRLGDVSSLESTVIRQSLHSMATLNLKALKETAEEYAGKNKKLDEAYQTVEAIRKELQNWSIEKPGDVQKMVSYLMGKQSELANKLLDYQMGKKISPEAKKRILAEAEQRINALYGKIREVKDSRAEMAQAANKALEQREELEKRLKELEAQGQGESEESEQVRKKLAQAANLELDKRLKLEMQVEKLSPRAHSASAYKGLYNAAQEYIAYLQGEMDKHGIKYSKTTPKKKKEPSSKKK